MKKTSSKQVSPPEKKKDDPQSSKKSVVKFEWQGMTRGSGEQECGEPSAPPAAKKRGRPRKWDKVPAPAAGEKRPIGRPKKWLYIPHVDPTDEDEKLEGSDPKEQQEQEIERKEQDEMENEPMDQHNQIQKWKGKEKAVEQEQGLTGNSSGTDKPLESRNAGKRMWSIKVSYGGHISRSADRSSLYYDMEGRPAAYIHNVNPFKFGFFDLCHAVLGKLSGSKENKVMWFETKGSEFHKRLRPIAGDDDVQKMFDRPKEKGKCLAHVLCQEYITEFTYEGDQKVVIYRLHKRVPRLPNLDGVIPWKKIEMMIAAKENALKLDGEELRQRARDQMEGRQWYVSFIPKPFEKSKVTEKGYDDGFYVDSYINKLSS